MLSPDVVIGKGAIVRNCILWDKVVVEEGAVLDRVICDKRCVIGKGARVGVGDDLIPNHGSKTACLGRERAWHGRARASRNPIGRNCIIDRNSWWRFAFGRLCGVRSVH